MNPKLKTHKYVTNIWYENGHNIYKGSYFYYSFTKLSPFFFGKLSAKMPFFKKALIFFSF